MLETIILEIIQMELCDSTTIGSLENNSILQQWLVHKSYNPRYNLQELKLIDFRDNNTFHQK